jgi:hypothetical protein
MRIKKRTANQRRKFKADFDEASLKLNLLRAASLFSLSSAISDPKGLA